MKNKRKIGERKESEWMLNMQDALAVVVDKVRAVARAIELFAGLWGNAFSKLNQTTTLLNVTGPPCPPTMYPRPVEFDSAG